ncbi:helix-turn-helix domain-containing protein [Buttiauxella noackiae]|uniref:Cyclic nucleotide-binding protein n=1 Tax=Buttiauxella noackiae ATCC 51607 TaxID=1354255 RepID=A0A1B7I0I0_9ENTR|nr:helix-turn-helix domain-containing protein [Buttiauxella noackiae]OAT21566.1 cyclic nucleotide-binding protein [Buttiauxella noackiae ATCC 51607]
MNYRSDVGRSVKVVGEEIEKCKHAFFAVRKKGQHIELIQDNQVAFLKSGVVTIHRIEDGLLTNSIKAPAVIGLGHIHDIGLTHFIQCKSECSMWILDSNIAFDLFTEKNLWQDAFFIIRNYLYICMPKGKLIHKSSAREIVVEHLKEIWALDESERYTTSVYNFILSRNNISRSAIQKVVRELEDSGDIKFYRGKLIELNEMA